MKALTQTAPVSSGKLLDLAQRFITKVATARRERLQRQAGLDALRRMDAHLLDDLGLASPATQRPLEELCQLNPAVLAATLFSAPRRESRNHRI